MIVIPSIISESTIPSQETWNQYIKVTANMTETAIKLRRKKQLQQKIMKHYAMKMMRVWCKPGWGKNILILTFKPFL